MAETTSRVYDLTYPSPVTLKEMSAIAIVAELWRKEIASEEITTWDELKLAKDIVLKKVTPNIPSTIYDLLIKYAAKFRVSIADWIKYHSEDVLFDTDYNSYIELLNKFHNFVWDWNGDIHYVRTAKRMMQCDQFTAVEKFQIACWYCFEDDIERIWSFVSWNFDLAQIDFNVRPLLYYWICCLRNELHNLPNPLDEPIDEVIMFNKCESRDFLFALEYFWNRIPHERRSRPTVMLSMFHSSLFARFTLPRLNDFELEEFLAEEGVEFMYSLLTFTIEKVHVLPAWMYIRNKLNRSQCIRLIEKLLEEETRMLTAKERLNSNDKIYLCCEIWKNYPENMKQWVLNYVLLNETLFKSPFTRSSDTQPREMRFLITVLLDASFEQRHKFWCKNWRNLISGARVKDLLRVMKLCFRDENDVSLFKEQHMSKYENIGPYCVKLLKECYFKELRVFLSFCCSDEQKLRELKQQLLRSNFLGGNSSLSLTMCRSYYKELNALVEDAFAEDVDRLVEFKSQFVSSPKTEDYFCDYIDSGDFDDLIQFVETFAPEEAVHVLKQRLLNFFNEYLVSGVIYEMKGDQLQRFLVWLLDSEDEIGKFKQSLPVDDIYCNVIQDELEQAYDSWNGRDDYINVTYPDRLDDFLNWYFNNDAEEIREIKERNSDYW